MQEMQTGRPYSHPPFIDERVPAHKCLPRSPLHVQMYKSWYLGDRSTRNRSRAMDSNFHVKKAQHRVLVFEDCLGLYQIIRVYIYIYIYIYIRPYRKYTYVVGAGVDLNPSRTCASFQVLAPG